MKKFTKFLYMIVGFLGLMVSIDVVNNCIIQPDVFKIKAMVMIFILLTTSWLLGYKQTCDS